jgi:hypothetical protein
MKEDVLEQVVEDYLQTRGYFTRHNVRFKPAPDHPEWVQRDDAVASDIDVIGVDPRLVGPERVWVVSRKSWQQGFSAASKLAELRGENRNPKRETWKHFREIYKTKWSEAFRREIQATTGATTFRYSIAVTRLTDSDPAAAEAAWSSDPVIAGHLVGCEFSFLTVRQMWGELQSKLATAPAPSEIGRLAQLLKAARIEA